MMNFKVKLKQAVIFCSVLTLSGCAVVDPSQSHVHDKITNALTYSLHHNEALYPSRVKKTTPEKRRRISSRVTRALLPKVSVAFNNEKDYQHRFNVTADKMPARVFFMHLVKGTTYDIVVDPDVQGDISVVLNKVTVPEAIKAVCDAYSLEYRSTPYGYRISTRKLVTRMYYVSYLNLDRKGTSETRVSPGTITERVGGGAAGGGSSSGGASSDRATSGASTAVKTTLDNDFWERLESTLKGMIGSEAGRKVVVNPDSSLVLVRAYPDEQRVISRYLARIQKVMDKQVVLEARVLEVRLDAAYQSGIQWQALGLNLNGTGTFANQLFDSSNAFSLAIHSGRDFNSVINLLNSQGRTEVLSSPHIATMNNQKAIIKVGDDEFFITNVSSTTSGSLATEVTQDVEFTPFFSGIALDVTPEINDDNTVTLHVHPVVSTVERENLTYNLTGRSGEESSVPLAKSTIRESDSIVRAKNNQVIIIGGLIANVSRSRDNNVPGVDQTVLKDSFGRHDRASDKIELVILLKPVIVNSNRVWNDGLYNMRNQFKGSRGAFTYTVGVQPMNKYGERPMPHHAMRQEDHVTDEVKYQHAK